MEEDLETYSSDEDTRLMLAVKDGDAAAFEELMARNQPKVLTMLIHFTDQRELSEDLTQEVFLKVYRARETYTPTAKFSTWLYRIVHNLALNVLRSKQRRPELLFGGTPQKKNEDGNSHIEENILAKSGYIPTRQYDRKEESEMVHIAMKSLGERQREAILYRHFEGMNYEQIAEVMELSPKAVKSLLCRARQKLAEILSPYMREGRLPE